MIALPPLDRQRSPLTGWTRAHWEAAADALLDGVAPYASKHAALYEIPGRHSISGRHSDGLEGFARTFLLAAFRIAGARGQGLEQLVARYREGIEHGTDPRAPDPWPAIEPSSQPMVEAASIAIGLYETRPWIWEQMEERARSQVVDWLCGFHGKPALPNNWLLFNVMVNSFLKSVGAPHRQDEIDANLDLIDAMYRRDGWYSDGFGRNYDHYIGWAMHLYTILWCRMDGDRSDPARAAEYRRRIARFLDDAQHLYAADGAPMHQGRSLIYRFAAAAPLWAGALADATPLPPGLTRRIASGAVAHFLDRPVLRDGVLSMGWYDEYLPTSQPYSGPASPYWASKAFLGLLLPPEHPVWTETEEGGAIDRADFVRAIEEPGWLIWGGHADGIVRMANHGSDRWPWRSRPDPDPHYRKLAYSTHTAPGTGPADADDLDAQFTLLDEGGRPSRRARIHPIAAADRFAASVWFPGEARAEGLPDWGDRIETVSIAHGPAEIRVHHVTSYEPRTARDAGFALAGSEAPSAVVTDTSAIVRRDDGIWCGMWGLHGFTEGDAARETGANAVGLHAAVPFVRASGVVRGERVLVSLNVLAGSHIAPSDVRASVTEVGVDGRRVRVRCSDGTEYVVCLVAPSRVEGFDGEVRFGRMLDGRVVFAHRC